MPQWRKLHTKTTESWTLNEMPDDFHRLLWLLLPLISCREGRGQADPSWIKARALTLRGDVTIEDVSQAMDFYQQAGIIKRYLVNGRQYYVITNWEKHQGNTSKEAESIYPVPTDESFEDYSRLTPDLLQSYESTEESGMEENGMEQGAKTAPAVPSTFEQWQEGFQNAPNQPGYVGTMLQWLYPAYYKTKKPNYGMLASMLKKHDSDYMLSLIFQHSARPPVGDPVKFVAGILQKDTTKHGPPSQPVTLIRDAKDM